MTKKQKKSSDPLAELRQQAEAKRNKKTVEIQKLSIKEVRRLVEELQTHQIELEMQNEELRQAQEALIDARDEYADLYDFSPVGYLTLGEKGLIEAVNLTTTELLGVERQSLLGERLTAFIIAEDQETFYRHRQQVLKTGQRQVCELHLINADGAPFQAQLESTSMNNGDRLRISLSDITKRKHLEREQIRMERMQARSEMADGISHNLNNLLNGILLPAQLLKDNLDDPLNLKRAELIERTAIKATAQVRRLNSAVQSEEEELKAVALLPIIHEAVGTTQPQWKTVPEQRGITIALVTQLEGVPLIRGIASDLHDLLINMILNAVDALPGGGTITIGSKTIKDYAQLTVHDTGKGMDEETKRRVFEPFFSTKIDVGSGLGLYTVYLTVKRCGGTIKVVSAPDQGTTFTMQLPIWTATDAVRANAKL